MIYAALRIAEKHAGTAVEAALGGPGMFRSSGRPLTLSEAATRFRTKTTACTACSSSSSCHATMARTVVPAGARQQEGPPAVMQHDGARARGSDEGHPPRGVCGSGVGRLRQVEAAHPEVVADAIAALRYGSVCVNVSSIMGFSITKLPWGAFPGNMPEVGLPPALPPNSLPIAVGITAACEHTMQLLAWCLFLWSRCSLFLRCTRASFPFVVPPWATGAILRHCGRLPWSTSTACGRSWQRLGEHDGPGLLGCRTSRAATVRLTTRSWCDEMQSPPLPRGALMGVHVHMA